MNWTRLDAYYWQSEDGYRIAVARAGGEIHYSAFAPALDYEVFKNRMRSHYALGQPVPQQRELLGTFRDPNAAREACATHLGAQTVVTA
jgi:hypothetical protein